jgi:exosortase F-associated protein
MIIPDKHKWSRWLLGFLAIGLMALVYIFQNNWLWLSPSHTQIQYLPFILNRFCRLILNDTLCIILFLAIFNSKKELTLASIVFMAEVLIVLPFYLVVKLTLEGDSEISAPLLSFIHRLIVNPLLMMVLLAGLLYQKYRLEK